jgi:geranylgeranyl pyrophosphate synthase
LATSTADHALEAYLTDTRLRVDGVLERWSTAAQAFWPVPVPAAVRYSVLSAGKRLRPTLVYAAYEALGGDHAASGVGELAAAVEVVHAYSLVHDDLPCMDDDDLRRGRPTVHRAFDVPAATSAGFHMVGLAARVLASGLDALRVDSDRRRSIALELFRAAGAGGMIGGQVLDLEAEGLAISIEALREVHQRKTGALIAAACVIGGLAAGQGAPAEHVAALRAYGEAIGRLPDRRRYPTQPRRPRSWARRRARRRAGQIHLRIRSRGGRAGRPSAFAQAVDRRLQR